ncbi:hypothetical protein [Acidisphaera rubrifaciens]|uniref:Carbohydrate-binding family V/XII n=1 Tax=Acidisphaera rubrifaciens HS-AP3 TaxID=1231350 RepID=A0A0D6P7Y6_9PROT|nr:hypothetical protein [Acidisphaera rubrifaciens]GAN77885.1 hypothetical protein Asru_0496_02 [Acidisphaera rubrifaciens HS-AP3]
MRLDGPHCVALALLAAALTGSGSAAWGQATTAPPVASPAASRAAAPAETATPAWPHTITENGAAVTIYQPQAVSWPDRATLTARAAVAVTPAGEKTPILGTIDVTLATQTDAQTGLVQLSDPRLISSRFPSLDTQKAAQLEARLRAALARMQVRAVPLATILLSLQQTPAAAVAVNNDPPVIFYADRPASLVVFDGAPVLAPIGTTGLSFAVNTNWDVFSTGGQWYLLDNGLWLTAPAADGPYTATTRLPPQFARLPNDANFAEARKYVPPHALPPAAQIPHVFVSLKPAEIIVTAGAPHFAPVAGTSLQRVENTGSALFRDPAQGKYYLLLSGRWFAAADLQGPWTYATDSLPPDFAAIRDGTPEATVLASVPGTVDAQEAMLKAAIPTTATLKRGAATPEVAYYGTPRFEPIPGTSIRYGVNTGAQVLLIGGRYYACDHGAWFVAPAPTGPWTLADSIPPEIRQIPPSSPLYNVTYVQVYSATPQAVTYGYTAGYLMGFVTASVLVYGTGYYHPPYVVPGLMPIYHPYPYTYASNVWYNPATGGWARGGTVWGPYGGAATGGRYYNPATGGWARGGAVYGPYGGAGAWSYYNPRTGTYAHGSAAWGNGSATRNAGFYNARYGVSGATSQGANPYGRWGSSTVSGPARTVDTQSRSGARGSAGSFSSSTGARGGAYQNRYTGNSGAAVRGPGGDVYAGRDGNVYRHTDSGWSKWNNGGWNTMKPPASTGRVQGRQDAQGATLDRSSYQQLERDRAGRQAGRGYGEGRFGGGGRFQRN